MKRCGQCPKDCEGNSVDIFCEEGDMEYCQVCQVTAGRGRLI